MNTKKILFLIWTPLNWMKTKFKKIFMRNRFQRGPLRDSTVDSSRQFLNAMRRRHYESL